MHEAADLDGRVLRLGEAAGDLDGALMGGDVDDVVAADVLGALGEWAAGGDGVPLWWPMTVTFSVSSSLESMSSLVALSSVSTAAWPASRSASWPSAQAASAVSLEWMRIMKRTGCPAFR
ncbi:hypothetical protein ASC54_12325 [Yonghaparkia sp. Root332]|nr:hypothetical protein ASC54_12325 [Yonghaparkia sp. Root332]